MKKKRGHKGTSPPDLELWRRVARTVTPYHEADGENPAEEVEEDIPAPKRPAAKAAPPPKAAPGKGFDSSTERKLKRGQLEIEGTLDLHGMTQAGAHAALHRFISRAVKAEKRNLLIITGKGARLAGGGVLRRMLPVWLEDAALAPFVLALTPARPKDGGEGAFYLRLRKAR